MLNIQYLVRKKPVISKTNATVCHIFILLIIYSLNLLEFTLQFNGLLNRVGPRHSRSQHFFPLIPAKSQPFWNLLWVRIKPRHHQ
jgi:hypothetical protein